MYTNCPVAVHLSDTRRHLATLNDSAAERGRETNCESGGLPFSNRGTSVSRSVVPRNGTNSGNSGNLWKMSLCVWCGADWIHTITIGKRKLCSSGMDSVPPVWMLLLEVISGKCFQNKKLLKKKATTILLTATLEMQLEPPLLPPPPLVLLLLGPV